MPLPLPTAETPLAPLLVAALGTCTGSFINVVAWRLPRQESLLLPGSHCPRCGTTLAWFENIPLLSWLVVRGRCRHCQAPVALRYPAVELLLAGLWTAAWIAARAGQPSAMGPAADGLGLLLSGWLLLSWLVPLALIDRDRLWLPEPLCRHGLLLGLLCTALLGFHQGWAIGAPLLLQHLVAAGSGLVGFEAVSALAERLIGRPALGLGDAKLAALLGAWLGLSGLGLTVILAVLGGALVGVIGRLSGRLGRHDPMPFGPFLAAGGAAVWLLGNGFWQQHLLQPLGWGIGPA
jgi:leader peptidase (prepilin peptidase)/N-methyltransferase